MLSRLPNKGVEPSMTLDCFTTRHYFKFRYLETRSTRHRKFKFRLFAESNEDKWKLRDIDANSTQETLKSWLSKTQNFLTEVTSPLAKSNLSGKPFSRKELEVQAMQQVFMAEQTIDSTTPNGNLSLAAILSIEQFSRMNGLTGFKMQKIFKALVEESVYNDRRNLVEYCCFRFLSRDSSAVHPCLKEPAFQQLIFITMLAWENPYAEENDSGNANLQGKFVCEEAFLRIAPAIPGVADHSTAHNLFKALCGEEPGISLQSWLTYIDELLKVHEGRKSYQNTQHPQLSKERILCLGSSRKQPVLKWENNLAWPGKVILTEKALYFEAVGLVGKKDMIRFDLTRNESHVYKTKVGPFGSRFLDSAVLVSHGPRSHTWVLEFVDLGGELRRDVWHAFISEVIALHRFLHDFGPENTDQSVSNICGAQKGYERATTSAVNSISRLQALQFAHKMLDDPIKLVQFSYLQNAPHGDLVLQTLALNFWGGPLSKNFVESEYQSKDVGKTHDAAVAASRNVFNIDGSVYPKKWMRSPSWATTASLNFWKNCSIKQGVVLSKNLVVAGATLVEKAATTCKEKSQVAEKTQATIDAATLKGIPSNIDLFKELMLPLTLVAMRFEKLRRWEKPHLTVSFLVFANAIIFRNLLSYVLPAMMMVLATAMLALKGLKQQGRLGRLFGKVTIRDQPPSNTIQKIIAVKDAMQEVEYRIQNLNVTLLKIRTIFLAGQPEITTEVAVAILSFGVILLLVPFKYVAAFLLFDLFTRELEFRKEMVKKFITFLTERWEQVPAAPVVVLPFETGESRTAKENKDVDG